MVLDIKRTPILDFVAGKDVFYLDGKMYYFLVDGIKNPSVRGSIHTAFYDVEDVSLVLRHWDFTEVRIPFNQEVTWCEDVGIFLGASNHHATNRLKRFAHRRPADIAAWRIMKRVTMGVVDYRIFRDSQGLVSTDRHGLPVEKSKPSVTLVQEGFGRGKNAWVFEFINDEDNSRSMVLPADADWVWAGPNIAFSSTAASEEGRSFV